MEGPRSSTRLRSRAPIWLFVLATGCGSAAEPVGSEPPPETAWRPGPELPAPVVSGEAVMAGRTIYVADGVPYGDGKEVYRLDRTENVWIRVADLPESRSSYALVALGDSLYALGGSAFVPGQGMVAQPTVFVYSIAHDVWREGVPMPMARVDHAAVAVADRIVVVGGRGESAPVAAVSIFEPATGQWREGSPLPTQRIQPKIETVDGVVFVFGGWKPGVTGYASELELIHDVEAYDVTSNTWRLATTLRSTRLRFGTVRVGTRIHVIGGYEPILIPSGTTVVEPVNTHEIYDPGTNTWTVREPGITPRFDLAVAQLDDALLAIGGVRGTTVTRLVELWTLPSPY